VYRFDLRKVTGPLSYDGSGHAKPSSPCLSSCSSLRNGWPTSATPSKPSSPSYSGTRSRFETPRVPRRMYVRPCAPDGRSEPVHRDGLTHSCARRMRRGGQPVEPLDDSRLLSCQQSSSADPACVLRAVLAMSDYRRERLVRVLHVSPTEEVSHADAATSPNQLRLLRTALIAAQRKNRLGAVQAVGSAVSARSSLQAADSCEGDARSRRGPAVLAPWELRCKPTLRVPCAPERSRCYPGRYLGPPVSCA
jgi:hypothetical protein